MDTEKDYKNIGTADGRLVLYALNMMEPRDDGFPIAFTNKPNRLNEFQTQAKNFISQITSVTEPTDERYSPYVETKFNILKAIITQAYPQLKNDISKEIIVPTPYLCRKPDAVRISDEDGTLNIYNWDNQKFVLYKISEEWLPKSPEIPITTSTNSQSAPLVYQDQDEQNPTTFEKIGLTALVLAGFGILADSIALAANNNDDNKK